MKVKVKRYLMPAVLILTGVVLAVPAAGQFSNFKPPETIISSSWIKIILNEISGQLPFNNEIMMSGYNHIRTDEEFNGHFYEAEHLAGKLREYGIDEVRLEDLGEKNGPGGWWVRQDAELWMIKPEEKRLSRLEEHPALMSRMTDSGEWEGELVYLDKRDIRNLEGKDFSGKIILTPLSAGYLVKALENGAMGIVSYFSHAKDLNDPYQVIFNMRFDKGKAEHPAFGFNIWRHLGEQLRDRILEGQKIVVRAEAETKNIPYKLDTVFAAVKGTDPDKKGLMFTAHLFERPVKQGANDNISGCVVLSEIARTLTTLIKEGRLDRPERNIYFLMGEEGGSTMAFFKKYPEMAGRILGVINMDMVGEDLEKNSAFFNIERSSYSKPTFIDSAAVNAARYVFETNIERHSHMSRENFVDFPVPIVEKNGTKQPFRYTTSEHEGGSDHSVFINSDSGIPALSFNCWPDLWYHTDKDRPDKSDPTQLKRVAFIGTMAAMAVCSGNEEVLENLIRIGCQDKLSQIQETMERSMNRISELENSDGGKTFKYAVRDVRQAAKFHKKALLQIRELTLGKNHLNSYLNKVTQGLDEIEKTYTDLLTGHYMNISELRGFSPDIIKSISSAEKKLGEIVPAKVKSIALGDRLPFRDISNAIRANSDLRKKMFRVYPYRMFIELYLSIDGKRSLADIRSLISFAYVPVPEGDFLKMAECLKEAELITY